MGSNPISPFYMAEMAEWSKAADCKFALVTTHWFKSSSPQWAKLFKIMNYAGPSVFSALEKFDIFIVVPIRLPYFNWDLSLTNLSLYVLFVVISMIFLSYLAIHEGKLIPNFYQISNEYLLKFVFNIVDKQIVLMDMFMDRFYLYCLCLYF